MEQLCLASPCPESCQTCGQYSSRLMAGPVDLQRRVRDGGCRSWSHSPPPSISLSWRITASLSCLLSLSLLHSLHDKATPVLNPGLSILCWLRTVDTADEHRLPWWTHLTVTKITMVAFTLSASVILGSCSAILREASSHSSWKQIQRPTARHLCRK